MHTYLTKRALLNAARVIEPCRKEEQSRGERDHQATTCPTRSTSGKIPVPVPVLYPHSLMSTISTILLVAATSLLTTSSHQLDLGAVLQPGRPTAKPECTILSSLAMEHGTHHPWYNVSLVPPSCRHVRRISASPSGTQVISQSVIDVNEHPLDSVRSRRCPGWLLSAQRLQPLASP